jgi:hypothetical protein
MAKSTTRTALFLIVAALGTQTACYNTYFIEKDELAKLESSVEQREVVEVYGDCPAKAAPAPAPEARYRILEDSNAYAQADTPPAPAEGGATATDAGAAGEDAVEPGKEGCMKVPVSTGNSLKIVKTDGTKDRVTPFNFIMSDSQLVSPEYDLLENLNDVEGAEVKQFSTWKTVATIAGVTIASVGTFVAIGLLAEDGGGFTN